ncbi:MAG: DUF2207 domain-containing protein [Actinomycetes bacterium]
MLLLWTAALTVGLGLAVAQPAAAATGDVIEDFAVSYDVRPSGVVAVEETITYRFGPSSGRHGIERYLVTRERYDDDRDAVYRIDNVQVTSPDDVATQYSSRVSETNGGRGEQLRLRIGDPDETIYLDTATYVISYDVAGALRTSGGYDEFYWDVTGFDWSAPIERVTVQATVPGGARDVSCFAGPVGSRDTCDGRLRGGAATFTAGDLAAGEGVSVGVKIASGLLAVNSPILEPDGSRLTTGEKVAVASVGGAGLVSLVGAPIAGFLWWRRHGRDQRYAGLAPGTVPLPGQAAEVVMHDPDIPIPVAFSPPKIPVAEAGLLIDGQVDTRETAATIIDLAVHGALTVHSAAENDFRVILVDPNRATAPHEMVLLNHLFAGSPPGAAVDLSAPGSLVQAHRAMQTSVRNQVAARGWFRKVPSATATTSAGFGVFALILFGIFGLGAAVLWVLVPLLPVIITVVVIRAKLRRGQRTPDGRAVCDQVEGFRTYLATAEADQLRFEEGEDIFSRYLPWAIAFELADRWARICADLVAVGRIPDAVPSWYVGNYYSLAAFNTGFLTSSLTSAASPAPASGAGGTGFGGGSSFGGGGFSGGGGGGGGGGSW